MLKYYLSNLYLEERNFWRKMKKEEKRLILILLIILLIAILLLVRKNKKSAIRDTVMTDTGYSESSVENEVLEEKIESYVTTLEDGTKLNTSEALKANKKIDDLEFSNIQLTNKDGQSVLLATVENKGSKATEITLVDVVILDRYGSELGKIGGIIGPLEPGGSNQFNSSTTANYVEAYDFKVVKK